MGLLGGLAVGTDAAGELRGRDGRGLDRVEVAEQFLRERQHRVGIDRAGGRDDQPRRAIFLGQPAHAIVAGQREDRLFASQDRSREWLGAKRGLEQMVMDQIVGRIEAFAELGQDDLLLTLQLGLVDFWRAHQIGDQLEREIDIGGQGAGVEHGLVARGPGVERAADILDRFGDGAGIAAPGPLEHHMLKQMGEPALAIDLRSGPDAGIKPDGGRSRARHRVDRDGQAVGQAGQLGGHFRLSSFIRVRSARM